MNVMNVDAWVNVAAIGLPRRAAIVRVTESVAFTRDVPWALLVPRIAATSWASGELRAEGIAWMEKVARQLAEGAGAPAGCTLLAIAYHYATHSVDILIEHPSLPIVTEGQEAPVWPEAGS